MNKKKLLVLGGAEGQVKLIESVDEQSVRVVAYHLKH